MQNPRVDVIYMYAEHKLLSLSLAESKLSYTRECYCNGISHFRVGIFVSKDTVNMLFNTAVC